MIRRASADLDVGQIAAAHLVIEQVAGGAGQAGGLIGGAGKPPAVHVPACTAGGLRRCRHRVAADLRYAGETRLVQVPGHDAYGAGRSLSCLGVGLLTFPVVVQTGCIVLGDPVDRVVPGQAEFGGPAFDERPEPVPLVQVSFARRQGRRGSWR